MRDVTYSWMTNTQSWLDEQAFAVDAVIAMPSRGSRPKTPRSAIPTSYYGNARPDAPDMGRPWRPTPSPSSNDCVQVGSVVVLQDKPGLAIHEYMIAVSHRSGTTPSQITTSSPLGAALIGRKVGDVITRSGLYGRTHWEQEIVELRGATGQPPNQLSQRRTRETEAAAAEAEQKRNEEQHRRAISEARRQAAQRAAEAERREAEEQAAQAFAALPWWRRLITRRGNR